MPNDFQLKQSSAVLMAALAAAFPLTGQAAGAARIDFTSGDVKALTPDGRSRTLDKGAEIASGETIDTGNGRAQVRFTDGAQVSLQPQTQFRIDDYRFSGKADGSEKGFFSLLKGGLRTITGLVGRSNRDNYKVTTTVATIGIRGTEYSVAYGNSITATTGDGIVELCNAAGCLLLHSGETGHVKDNNTAPALSSKKTELSPPQPEFSLPGFIAGDTASGGFPVLPSGPGYSLALAGMKGYDSGEGMSFDNHIDGPDNNSSLDGQAGPTYAGFAITGALTNFNGADGGEGATSVAAGVTVGALSDGIIGWGRWAGGSLNYSGTPYAMQDVHYVAGIPTPAADMSALQTATMIGTYTMVGFTYPTAFDGTVTTVGTLPVSATLMANFQTANVSGNLNVPIGGNTYSDAWSGSINGSKFSSSGSGAASVQGFFAGANASRAGLVYQFAGTPIGHISGAVAFRQTGLCVAGTGC